MAPIQLQQPEQPAEDDFERMHNADGLSSDFGSLRSLQVFYIHCCPTLRALPDNFSRLSSLKLLVVSGCDVLTSLPDDFGALQSLQVHMHSLVPEFGQFAKQLWSTRQPVGF